MSRTSRSTIVDDHQTRYDNCECSLDIDYDQADTRRQPRSQSIGARKLRQVLGIPGRCWGAAEDAISKLERISKL